MLLLIQYTLIFASVLILVALGGCISEHSGVINLGLEGIMVIGALGGALMMKYMPEGASPFVLIICTVLMAIIAGVVYSSLLAVACINFKADQTIIGTALNLLGVAAATVIVKAINTAENPDNVSSEIQYIAQKKAFLVNIGSFEFNWFMLLALIALLLVAFMLYRTRFGLRLMACGEHPQAAASVGIDVYKMRWAGVLLSGALGGLGGVLHALLQSDRSAQLVGPLGVFKADRLGLFDDLVGVDARLLADLRALFDRLDAVGLQRGEDLRLTTLVAFKQLLAGLLSSILGSHFKFFPFSKH